MRTNSMIWAGTVGLCIWAVAFSAKAESAPNAVGFGLAAVAAALMSGLYRIAAALEERQCPTYSTRSGYGPRRD